MADTPPAAPASASERAEIAELTSELRSSTYHYTSGSTKDLGNQTGPTDMVSTPITKMPLRVKLTFGCPQFSVFSVYMLITVHATL